MSLGDGALSWEKAPQTFKRHHVPMANTQYGRLNQPLKQPPLLPAAAGDTGEMFHRHAPSARTPLVSLNAFSQYLQQTD